MHRNSTNNNLVNIQNNVDVLNKKVFAIEQSINTILEVVKGWNDRLKKEEISKDLNEQKCSRKWEHIDPDDVPSNFDGTLKYDETSFVELYKSSGFDALWEDAKKHGRFLDKYDGKVPLKEFKDADWWPENIYNSKDMFCQIVECLEYFNILKIAEHIYFVNKHASKRNWIQTSGVDNLSVKEIYDGLYDNVKNVCERLIKWGTLATKNSTMLLFQSGRIRLESIYYYNKDYPDDSYPVMRLYWTDSFESANED